MNINTSLKLALAVSIITASVAWSNEDIDLDIYFRTMNEVSALEQQIFGTHYTDKKEVGPLTSIFACVSSSVAANETSKVMEMSVQKTLKAAFASVPFGGKLLEELEKMDPTLFQFKIDELNYSEECNEKIKNAKLKKQITEKHVAATIRLSEYGGKMLGAYMTQGLGN